MVACHVDHGSRYDTHPPSSISNDSNSSRGEGRGIPTPRDATAVVVCTALHGNARAAEENKETRADEGDKQTWTNPRGRVYVSE